MSEAVRTCSDGSLDGTAPDDLSGTFFLVSRFSMVYDPIVIVVYLLCNQACEARRRINRFFIECRSSAPARLVRQKREFGSWLAKSNGVHRLANFKAFAPARQAARRLFHSILNEKSAPHSRRPGTAAINPCCGIPWTSNSCVALKNQF